MPSLIKSYLVALGAVLGVLMVASFVFHEPVPVRYAFADGATTSVTVGNANPTITAVAVTPSPITLTENATTTVTVTATVTDTNGCSDVISSGTIQFVLYRTGVAGTSSCSRDANNCYTSTTFVTFTVQPSDTCTGGVDTTANVSSTVPVWYIADPTDASSSLSAQWWAGYVKAIDFSNGSSSATSTVAVEVNTLAALNVTNTINYNTGIGNLSSGQNTGTTNQTATTTNTGNSKIDIEFSGTDMTSSSNTIAATNERYATSSLDYSLLSHQLLTTTAVRDVNLFDASVTSTPNTSSTYWGITVPTGSIATTYTGTNTFTAVWSN
jgi:hypothetical protein